MQARYFANISQSSYVKACSLILLLFMHSGQPMGSFSKGLILVCKWRRLRVARIQRIDVGDATDHVSPPRDFALARMNSSADLVPYLAHRSGIRVPVNGPCARPSTGLPKEPRDWMERSDPAGLSNWKSVHEVPSITNGEVSKRFGREQHRSGTGELLHVCSTSAYPSARTALTSPQLLLLG